MGRPQNQGRPFCSNCKKAGHETQNCYHLKAANQSKKNQQKGNQRQNGRQQQPSTNSITCNHCKKVGHARNECFILNPSLKNQRRGQPQQTGGGSPKCAFCNKGGHTADGCFKAHPELKAQRGDARQQQESRCSYCSMPDHTVEACYVLNPEIQNPFHHQQQQAQQQQPWNGGGGNNNNNNNNNNDRNNDKAPPPPRLTQRINEAEALARELMPQNIRRLQKVRRVQGWHPARQTYFTLPLYGASVVRPGRHSGQNPFHQPAPQVAYEAYDTLGDTVMCSCGQPEGFECSLEHWVRKAVEKDKPLRFSDRAEEGYMKIMQDGLVDPSDAGVIY